MEARQPSRASFSRRRALGLVTESENQSCRHSFDSFLQEQAQRWQIGNRFGNRELCLRAKTRFADSLHSLIDILAVLSVNLADQARPQDNLERATLCAMPPQHLYLDVL